MRLKISVWPAWSKTLGSHVLPWRQTGKHILRLASARRAPLRQFERCMGIAVLPTGVIPARRLPRPVSAWRPILQLSLVGMTFRSTTALRRPSRVSHPWRCAQHQPPVAYFPPAKHLRQRRPYSTSHLVGSTQPKRQIYGLRFYPSRTTAVFFWKIDLPAAPSCRRVI